VWVAVNVAVGVLDGVRVAVNVCVGRGVNVGVLVIVGRGVRVEVGVADNAAMNACIRAVLVTDTLVA